jgi:uncharacterized membrane protein (UPF0136 family)
MSPRTVVGVYGIVNILGGVIGLVAAKSTMSLLAGGGAGLALLACWALAKDKPGLAFRAAGVLTLGLIGFWVFRFTEVQAAGKSVMMPVGNLGLGVLVLGFLTASHFAAHKRKASSSPAGEG